MRHTWGLVVIFASLALMTRVAHAQNGAALNTWLNAYVDSVAAARALQNNVGKTPQLPAGTVTRASIIDRANLPDVAGIAIALPTAQSGGGGGQPPMTSLSGSPLAIVSALLARNPLEPTNYLKKGLGRRLGLSTTWETDPSTGNSLPIIQAKLVIRERRNPLPNASARAGVGTALESATRNFGQIKQEILHILWMRVGRPAGVDSLLYMTGLEQKANFNAAMRSAGTGGRKEIEEAVERQIEQFVTVKLVLDSIVQESRKDPEFAIGYTQRGSGSDRRSRGAAIFDIGRGSFDFTANAAYNDTVAAEGHRANAEVALQGSLRLTQEDPVQGRQALAVTIAGNGSKWFKGPDRTGVFKLQGLVLIPVSSGVTVPISATWASKRELISESRIVGNIGFSFDLGQVYNATR